MAHRFLSARTRAGLTLRQAARQLTWSVGRLQTIEDGAAKPTNAEVFAMSALYQCRLAWLIGEMSSSEAIMARHGLTAEKIKRMEPGDRERFLEALDAVEFEEQMREV